MNYPLALSPIWLGLHTDQIPDKPFSMKTGQWSGAGEKPSIVADLLQEEINEGFELKRLSVVKRN